MKKYTFIKDEPSILGKTYPKSVLNQSNVERKGNLLEYAQGTNAKLFKIVAENEDQVALALIGTAIVRENGEIVNIYVEMPFRHNNYGQVLANICKDKLGAKFAISIDINTPSRKTFTNTGFKEIILEDLPKFPVYVLPEKEEEVLNSDEFKQYINLLKRNGNEIYQFNKSFITDKKRVYDSYTIMYKKD